MASRVVPTNVHMTDYTANASCTARSSHPISGDRPPPPRAAGRASDAARLPSNGDAENEELVFYDDHFSIDPSELRMLRFLAGDASVVDDLVQELEGSWQVILRESVEHYVSVKLHSRHI